MTNQRRKAIKIVRKPRKLRESTKLALQNKCPHCGAEPGNRCRTCGGCRNPDGSESFTADVDDSDIQGLAEQIMETVMDGSIFYQDGQNRIQLKIEEQIKTFLYERAIPE